MIFFFVLSLWSSVFSFSAPACTPDGGICIESVPSASGKSVEFWAESKRACSTTVTLEQEARNLGPVDQGTVVFTMERPTRKKVVERPILNSTQGWSVSFRFYAQCGIMGTSHDDSYIYLLPIPPHQPVRVSQSFHGSFSHNSPANEYAVDFDVPEGTPVYAAREGIVVDVIQDFTTGGPNEAIEKVNVVRVQHSDFTVAEYAHLRHKGAVVRVGQAVKRGELIAYSGNTGKSTGPHLHVAVHVPVDGKSRRSVPIQFLVEDGTSKVLQQGAIYQRQ